MLHKLLQKYLSEVEASVRKLSHCHIERYQEEVLTYERINLRIRIRFASGALLEINEALIIEDDEIVSPGYRYHFQDGQQHLVFRYDNAPHHPQLPTFPHHKHLPHEVVAAAKPSISKIIEEVLLNPGDYSPPMP